MKNEELLDMIGETSDELLKRAESPAKPSPIRWKRFAAVAAALVLCAGGTAWYIHSQRSIPKTPSSEDILAQYPDLPKLSANFTSGDMGFEGLELYDISDLRSGNPWHEDAQLTTLPVYENPCYRMQNTLAQPGDEEMMLANLRKIAAAVGTEFDETAILRYNTLYGSMDVERMREALRQRFETEEEVEEYLQSGCTYQLEARVTNYSLIADAWGGTRIEFSPPLELPEGANFGHHDEYERYITAAEYLKDAYRDILEMEQPTASIVGGDYNIDNEQSFKLYFYDAAGDLTQQIVNYNMNAVEFTCDDSRRLWLIDRNHVEDSQKVGDYPILTPKEAEAAFDAGDFLTTVPSEYFPQTMKIAKMELIYRTDSRDRYYLPFYRIYAKVSPNFEREYDTETYGVFYVPAVREEFVEFEAEEIHFN